ncbi:MAG: CvpA family protein [Oscillospiraceae bacterium]|nr:CvpA family protein [Oscillospiraceae bacterium]
MHILLDILLIAIILFCGWQGYKRGILGCILAIAFVIVAVWGANLIATTYSDEFTSMFRPFASGYLDRMEIEAIEEIVPMDQQHLSTDDLLRLDDSLESQLAQQVFLELGVYESRTEKLLDRYFDYRDQYYYNTVNHAFTNVFVYAFSFLLVFVISFLVILIGFTVVYNIIPFSFRLPGLKLVEGIGGGVLGIGQGLLLVFMLTWLLGYIGLFLPEDFLARSGVIPFFVRNNPMVDFIDL